MSEKFPEIFKNNIDNSNLRVQKDYYYKAAREEIIENDKKTSDTKVSRSLIVDKINSVFRRPNYVYQADVNIITKNGENMNKKIVGVKDNYLLTLDGKNILIDDIYDIK